MVRSVLIYLLFHVAVPAFSQTEKEYSDKVVALQHSFNDPGALQLAYEGLAKYPDSYVLMVNISFLHTTLAINATDKKSQEAHLANADAMADKLLKVHPDKSYTYSAKATSLGGMAITQPNKRKIDFAYEIKKHVDKAIKLDNSSSIAWHLLGRWSYEMASLSKAERFFAGIFYRAIPQAEMKDAIMYLHKSYNLDKTFVPNYLFLSLAYRKKGNEKSYKEFRDAGRQQIARVTNDIKILKQLNKLS